MENDNGTVIPAQAGMTIRNALDCFTASRILC